MKRMMLGLMMAGISAVTAHAAEDRRELVQLPGPMAEHMLGNMRDHLMALGDILDALAKGRAAEAGAIAESRLGMSSLERHGGSHMAPYMPRPMQEMGMALHRASSRLATAAQDAELDNPAEGQRRVYAALGEITRACNACHLAYRIR